MAASCYSRSVPAPKSKTNENILHVKVTMMLFGYRMYNGRWLGAGDLRAHMRYNDVIWVCIDGYALILGGGERIEV